MIYGSGLRAGFANTDHAPAYAQVNAGIAQEFTLPGWAKPTTRPSTSSACSTVST
jgi:hypothetical protein